MTVKELLQEGARAFQEVDYADRVDVEILLSWLMDIPRKQIYLRYDEELSSELEHSFWDLHSRRREGCPIAYILGVKEFYGRDFHVTPDVLVPRPETEHLLEVGCEYVRNSGLSSVSVVDVGTGSGVLAVSLCKEFSHVQVTGLDISCQALGVARKNAARHGVENRACWVHGDAQYWEPKQKFDMLLSNPPYVGTRWGPQADPDVVAWEPREALFSGEDGLDLIRALIYKIPLWLHVGGFVAFELASFQSERVEAWLLERGCSQTKIHRDYSGLPRLVSGRWDGN